MRLVITTLVIYGNGMSPEVSGYVAGIHTHNFLLPLSKGGQRSPLISSQKEIDGL